MKSRMLIFVAFVGLAMVVGCSQTPKTTATTPGPANAVALPPLPSNSSVTSNIVDSGPISVPAHPPVAPTSVRSHARTPTERVADTGTPKATTSSKLAKADGKHYVVKKGDTLSRIAKANYGDSKKAKQIALANKITDPNKIRAGQVLVLPAM